MTQVGDLLQDHITFEEAQSIVQGMNVLSDFFFNYLMEDEERAKEVASIIISKVMGFKVVVDDVTPQKTFMGIDKGNHGIRLDALVKAKNAEGENAPKASSVAYDLEMENRKADRKSLPKRHRFYSALTDAKIFNEGKDYDELSDYVSITFLSFDPFGAGDMYYEVRTTLVSHPDIDYDDGRINYFFYGGGKNNIPGDKLHSKSVSELVKYIVEGEIDSEPDNDLIRLDEIVSSVKKKSEVTRAYMKEWDRQRIHDKELTEKVKKETAINIIQDDHSKGMTDDEIVAYISRIFGFSEEEIADLLKEALSYSK
ncbi:hypothetical protein [Butyrivibrio sp. INlla16]|uniref:hypothetical protein n=1 Tax=Butyrivibrio sp. INlla16 TaxID=1520807 RepID=UPI00087E1095|nr:hypothetical protein [Butyrivibrio sp. INlla16]SDB41386.1 hypothetical protein SAMN02910263_01998 [Butyrivibrio sp. INlla16]